MAAVDPAAHRITLAAPHVYRLMQGNPSPRRYRALNVLEELDQPGEWCFDTRTLTLYFWPPRGTLDGAEVTIPVIDRLIELRATTHEPVRHLHFSGLTITQTLPVFPWIHPLNPDYLECNRPNSGGVAFYLENTEACVMDGCRFNQVGGDAIRLHGASTRNRSTRLNKDGSTDTTINFGAGANGPIFPNTLIPFPTINSCNW